MNQAGMILALILLSIPAEMVKRSSASKRSKSSKPSQYNTVQYNSVQYNTVQSNYEGVSDKGPPLPFWLPGRKRKALSCLERVARRSRDGCGGDP